jgi:hypothetical protein
MVLMSAGKAARNQASIVNKTSVFGIMGGLVPLQGYQLNNTTQKRLRGNNTLVIPLNPVPGLAFMKKNKLLSVNPQASGGVGKKVLMTYYN